MTKSVLASSRRLRRKRILLRVFFIFLLCLFLCVGFIAALFSFEKLQIKTITVKGMSALAAREVKVEVEKVISEKFLAIIPRNRIFWLPNELIKTRLLDRFERVKHVDIEKKGTSEILIKLIERKPAALLCRQENHRCFYLDETGFIFEEAPWFSSGVFVKFFDQRQNTPDRGEFLLIPPAFEEFFKFQSRLDNISKVREVYLGEEGFCKIYFSDAWHIILDRDDDLDIIYANFELFFREVLKDYEPGDLDYIDLRFGNKIYYKS
jgi:cell division septal protein FtsQ